MDYVCFNCFLPSFFISLHISLHGRLARWIKWIACDVGEAKEGLENELWRRWSDGRVGEWVVTQVKWGKCLRMSSANTYCMLCLNSWRNNLSARWGSTIFGNIVRIFLDEQFPATRIGRGSLFITWPVISPDLTPPDFFPVGVCKDKVYKTPVRDLADYKIIYAAFNNVTPQMLHKTWVEVEYRLNISRTINGAMLRFMEQKVKIPVFTLRSNWFHLKIPIRSTWNQYYSAKTCVRSENMRPNSTTHSHPSLST